MESPGPAREPWQTADAYRTTVRSRDRYSGNRGHANQARSDRRLAIFPQRSDQSRLDLSRVCLVLHTESSVDGPIYLLDAGILAGSGEHRDESERRVAVFAPASTFKLVD